MNKIIKQQLEKVEAITMPYWDENTTHLIIPKLASSCMIPGHYYIIKLDDILVHPPQDFELYINWNKGIVPQCNYFKCYCLQIMNRMVEIDGIGYDINTETDYNYSWEGWLPVKSVKVIRELYI